MHAHAGAGYAWAQMLVMPRCLPFVLGGLLPQWGGGSASCGRKETIHTAHLLQPQWESKGTGSQEPERRLLWTLWLRVALTCPGGTCSSPLGAEAALGCMRFPYFFLLFSGQRLRHMKVPRLRVKSELQLLAYTTPCSNAGSLTH